MATRSELEVPYQVAGQVLQALGELRNAEGTGNLERARAARKHLSALGYDMDPKTEDVEVEARKHPPVGRSATSPQVIRADSAVRKSPVGS